MKRGCEMTVNRQIPAPVAVSANRRPNGQFATSADPCGITEVLLGSWHIGYRVGPNGRIYADRAAAVRFALARQGRES
jgi:hypothetical protein